MSVQEEIFVTRSSMPSYEEYIEAIKPLWESRWLTNMGEYHRRLESELSDYLRVPEISLTVNGHMALELAIQSFNFPKDGEIITTPFTFISTTHAVIRNGLTPVFCDIKEDGTIDASKIENLITEKTVAILPVHVYGNICEVEKIAEIADRYGLKVIYDAAHAFGELKDEMGVGCFGDVSVFSFHATKVYNTIEGGAVVCNEHSRYETLYNLKNFGIRGEELVVSVGANAKMNEFSAIMGLCNLKHIDSAIDKRKQCHDQYCSLLDNLSGLRILTEIDNNNIKRNYAYFPIAIESIDPAKAAEKRNAIFEALGDHHIHARKYFYPITADQACFKNKYRNDKIELARDLSNRVLALPIYEDLPEAKIEEIAKIIRTNL